MKKLLLLLGASLLIFYFRQETTPHLFQGVAMTVPYRILVGGPVDVQQIEEKISEIFARTDRVYNKWNPSSELSLLNHVESMECSTLLIQLLKETDRLWKLTKGKFDPTIEGFIRGWEKLTIEDQRITKPLDLKIDLGGIAKGQTIDELTEELYALGYKNLLVEWGGDFRACGRHPEGRPWILSIVNPFGGALAEIELCDSALATSGDYEQFHLTSDGRHLTHIIDPFTGEPLERKKGSIVSCSVQAATCVEADALATGLMLFKQGEELNQWTIDHPDYSFHFLFFE